jgi:hypothetical protein
MRKLFWLATGLTAGYLLARKIDSNPAAKAVADDLAKSAREISASFIEGFSETHAEPEAVKPPTRKPAAK